MKLNKLFFGLLGLSAMVLSSCSDSDDYQWATASGEQVYFSNELPSTMEISMKESSFTVPVSRVNTKDASTVNITMECEDNFFTAPSSVSFAAGASTADITLSYDPTQLVYDKFRTVKLTIADTDKTNAYGYSSFSFKAGCSSPYMSIGKGVYGDYYYFGEEASVIIMQNQENPNSFRVVAPYSSITGGTENIELTILKKGDKLRDVTITTDDLVYFSSTNTGYHHSTYDADIWIHHPSAFKSLSTEDKWGYSKVLAWQDNGLPGQIQLAPYYYMDGVGGWNATAENEAIVITFPGYVIKDLSAELSCMGVMTTAEGQAMATCVASLGADVADARAIVVSADADPDAVVEAVAAGAVETTAVEGNGYVFVPIPEDLTGKLQVILVIFDEGVAKGYVSTAFEYYGGSANPWQSIGKGLYTEDFISSVFSAEPVTYEVEIEANTESPGLYRMLSPYGAAFPYNEEGDYDTSSTYNIEVNAIDPEGVYIPLQATGVDWGYGAISIASAGGYYLSQASFEEVKAVGYMGTLKDGVITLPVLEYDASDGSKAVYQGIVGMGSSAYYGGTGAFKIVLPEAVTASARQKARAQAKARDFAKRLNGEAYGFKDLKMAYRKAHINCRELLAD